MTKITRRNFVNGSLMALGGTLLPSFGQRAMASLDPSDYPPGLTGLRGSHPGSNEAAHSRAWGQQTDWGTVLNNGEMFDLVIIGAGQETVYFGFILLVAAMPFYAFVKRQPKSDDPT